MKRLEKIPLLFDRSFSGGIGKQVKWLLGIMLVVYLLLVVLTAFGFLYYDEAQNSMGRWYDVLFLLFDPGAANDFFVAPFAIFISLLGMIVFSGMLISVISNVLQRRVERYNAGETNYNVSTHVAVLGFNRSVPSLLKTIHESSPDSFILLMCDRDSIMIRDWLHANCDKKIEDKLIVMNGDITASDDLDRLCLHNDPGKIYVLGEEEKESHDAEVLVCVKKISEILRDNQKERKHPDNEKKNPLLECLVQINSSDIFRLLQQSDFSKIEAIDNLKFIPFNFNEIWAQEALAISGNYKGKDRKYQPLDGPGIQPESDKRIHLIIAGMNDMGETLAINAAHILHFPNFIEGDLNTYSRITFIDDQALKRGESFRSRQGDLFQLARWREGFEKWNDPLADKDSDSPYKYLGPLNFMDIEWEFIQGDVNDKDIRNYLQTIAEDEKCLSTLILCGENSERNIGDCIGLPDEVLKNFKTILVRQQESDTAVKLISEIPGKANGNIMAFGMMTECYKENLLSDEFGKLVNALYTKKKDEKIDLDNDPRIDLWWNDPEKPITDKWSSNYSANMLMVKLRSLGFNDDNISENAISKKLSLPETNNWIQKTEHNRWNTEKLLLGFKPMPKEEHDLLRSLSEDFEKLKVEKKKWAKDKKKHFNICSNETLETIDKKACEYDNTVNEQLWYFYKKLRGL